MKKVFFIISIIFFIQSNVFGQEESKYNYLSYPIKYGKTDFIIGYQYLNYNAIELGIARGFRGNTWGLSYANYHICSELLIDKNMNKLMGVKLGHSASICFFNFTNQLITYTNFNNVDYVYRPEIGVTFLGIIDLNYGYGFFIREKCNKEISNQSISLRWTFGKGAAGVF